MLKSLKEIKISGKEVLPLIEGGKGISVTKGLSSGAWAAARDDLVLMGSYAGLLTSASFLLFDFVWRD